MYKSYNEVVSTSIAWKPELDPYTTFNLWPSSTNRSTICGLLAKSVNDWKKKQFFFLDNTDKMIWTVFVN